MSKSLQTKVIHKATPLHALQRRIDHTLQLVKPSVARGGREGAQDKLKAVPGVLTQVKRTLHILEVANINTLLPECPPEPEQPEARGGV